MGRKPYGDTDGLKRGAWCAEEDKVLTDYIRTHGEGNGDRLLKKLNCRLRWLNYLKPDIKRAGRLPGQTDNEIKNFWNISLSKRIQEERPRRGTNSSQAPNDGDNRHQLSNYCSNPSKDDDDQSNPVVLSDISGDRDQNSSLSFLRDFDSYIHGHSHEAEINGFRNYMFEDLVLREESHIEAAKWKYWCATSDHLLFQPNHEDVDLHAISAFLNSQDGYHPWIN
ncbi:unnamed protein product [Malus baccata var. baccata]